MSALHGIAIFCDDIREEVDGKSTIVGVLTDNLNVPGVPGLLPKLGIYVRFHVPLDFHPVDVPVFISIPGQERMQMSIISRDMFIETIELARKHGNQCGGLRFSAVASPFQVHQAGLVSIECECDGKVIYLGALNITDSEQSLSTG